MAVQTIDNLRNRSKSIVEEVRANSVDGPRLGNLLIDFVDTVEELANKIENKVNISDITEDPNINFATTGKVLDARVHKQLLKKIEKRLGRIDFANHFCDTPFAIYKNGSIYRESGEKLQSSIMMLIVRDRRNGAIVRGEFVHQKPEQLIEIHLFIIDSDGEKNAMKIIFEMKSGKAVNFFTTDRVDTDNYLLELYIL